MTHELLMCHFQEGIEGNDVFLFFFFFFLQFEGIIRRLSIFSSISRTMCLSSRSRELQGMAIGEKMEKGGKVCPLRSEECLWWDPSLNSSEEKELQSERQDGRCINLALSPVQIQLRYRKRDSHGHPHFMLIEI